MVLPALVLFCIFVLYPVGKGFWVSLHRWDGLSEMIWVGVNNYKFVIDDDVFWKAMWHTFKFAIVVTIVKNVFGLLLAIMLNQKIRGQAFFRGATFLPVTFSFVVIGVLWSWIFNPTFGLLNYFLESVGLEFLIQGWLSDPKIALWSVMWVDIWKWTGFHMVLFLAGLQGIDEEYYEAASIDGAGRWQSFRHITIPLLNQVIAVSVLLSLLGAFVSNYDVVYVMTGGGPFHSTEVAMTWIVSTTFRFARVGKANAMSMILFAFAAVFGFFQFILTTRRAQDM
jgi:ABC-type sugar transport system permease subunit